MQSSIRFTIALLMVLVCSVPLIAADAVERFTFAVPNAPESTVDGKGRLTLTLNRWSTDAERDRMLEVTKERGHDSLLDAFRETGAVGYLRWPGGLEYSVRYAHRVERPDGGADVVLVVDRPLWVWWDTKGQASAASGATGTSGTAAAAAWATGGAPAAGSTAATFTVVQLRLNASGQGEGRISAGTNVASDARFGVLVPDYASRPVLLNDVRRETLG